jgi:uncharacterized phage-associated protein
MSMDNFAKHIISVVHNDGQEITNLQLQKIMYFSLQYALKNNLFTRQQYEELYDEPFLVWRYGPVVKNIYEKYKVYGSDPITESDTECSELSVLNNEIIKLSHKDVFDLVNKSHMEDYWRANENAIVGWRSEVAYGLGDIVNG